MVDDTSINGAQGPENQPQTAPARPNPFDQPALIDVADPAERPIPQCFLPMLDQLSEEHRGKLRQVDCSVATVRIRPRGGRDTKPEYLAGFVVDFAEEAAQYVGKGGPMLAIIDPNNGRDRAFAIGFVAPEPAGGVQQNSEVRALLERLEASEKRQQELMQLVLLGGAGQSQPSMQERIAELAALAQMFKSMNPAQDPASYVSAMGNVMTTMTQTMIGSMKTMQEAGQQLAVKPPERTIAQEVREIMEVPGATDLTMRFADRLLPPAHPVSKNGDGQATISHGNAFDGVA